MDSARRERLTNFALLPSVLVAILVLGYFTLRTAFQLERLRQQSVVEATLALANEKADRLDKRIVEEDNVVFAVANPAELTTLPERWIATAQRETPTIRAIVILDDSRTVVAFASRAGGAWADEEAFRRLLVRRMLSDMDLEHQPLDELHHLHHQYQGQGFLVSHWQRMSEGRRYVVVAWHDVARIVKDTLPTLLVEGGGQNRLNVNVVDENGRLVFGKLLGTSSFTVGVRFATTLYNWRLQISPATSEELVAQFENRRLLELVMVVLSCAVLVLGVATIVVAAAKERRSSELKSDFVANVSHELKTPLALVRMFGEMLQSGRVASDAKRAEYLDIIVSESERLTALIENVLDFARVERGRAAYEFSSVSIGDVVHEALNVVRYRAEKDGISIELSCEDDLPLLELDAHAVRIAVGNLVDNAIKYGGAGGVVRVTIRRANDRTLEIRVADLGPGIEPDEQGRIFERFVRGATAQSSHGLDGRPVRGSGIGLALVKHIIESHDGRVWVESAIGKGSTFGISLPIQQKRRVSRLAKGISSRFRAAPPRPPE